MVSVESKGIGTMGVDKYYRLYYDPEFVENTPIDELASVIIHEICHLVWHHHVRAQNLLPKTEYKSGSGFLDRRGLILAWNIAADMSINPPLKFEGLRLPDGCVMPYDHGLPDFRSAEWYYRQIMKNITIVEKVFPNDGTGTASGSATGNKDGKSGVSGASQPGSKPGQGVGAGGGGGSSKVDTKDDPDEAPSPGKDLIHDEEKPDEPEQFSPAERPGGSAADGEKRPWELGEPDDENPGIEEDDGERLAEKTADEVKQGGRGTEAGNWRLIGGEVVEPPYGPFVKLVNMIREGSEKVHGIGDRTYRRLSRRNQDPRIILPSNVSNCPRVAVGIDTSGSMSSGELDLCRGAVKQILRAFGSRNGITVVTGDTTERNRQIDLTDPSKIELVGGGGTDMAAVIHQLYDSRPKPELIIICTDGGTPWPSIPVGCKVVACLTEKSNGWGEVVPDWIYQMELYENE